MAVRIVTDSSCDLPQDLVEELGIEIVPLSIRFGDEEFVDRRDLTPEQFWAKLGSSAVLPETAAPSAGAFEDAFRRLADDGADAIVAICLSSKLSATLQSAEVGKKAVEGDCRVETVDSMSVSLALGNTVLAAARLAQSGAPVEQIVALSEDLAARSRLYGTLDTLEYLKKGGRIGGAQALLGSMLSIKPIIALEEGVVEPWARVRTRSKALRWLVDKVKEEGSVEQLAILHGAAPDVDLLLEMFEPLYPSADILVSQLGPVVGTHAGPRTIGVTYFRAG